MKLGVCQMNPEFGKVDENLERVSGLLDGKSFDLMVLPELFATGYQFRDKAEAASFAEDLNGPTINWAVSYAGDNNCFICGGFAEKDENKVYNSAFLAGPKGLVGVYRKTHLFNNEKSCFDPGDRDFDVYDIGIAKVGIMICFDWIFPESARILAIKGAQVILHPSNLVLGFCQDAMITRCIENGVFAATANRIGSEGRIQGQRLTFTGASQITAMGGKVPAKAAEDTEDVLIVDIDPGLAINKLVTPANDLMEDRRTDLYGTLCGDDE